MNISYNDLETYIAIIAIGYIYIHSHISPAIGEILKLCYVSVRVNYNELVDVTARQDLPRHDSSRLADTGEGDQVSDLKWFEDLFDASGSVDSVSIVPQLLSKLYIINNSCT